MSTKFVRAVLQHSKQKGNARLLLMTIAEYADDDGVSDPGNERLAEETNMSERQVQRLIVKLVEAGEMAVLQQGNGRGIKRTFHITVEPQKGDIVVSSLPSEERVTFENGKGDIPVQKGDISGKKGDIVVSPFGGTIGGKRKNIPTKKVTTSSAEDTATSPPGGKSSDHQKMFAKVCDIVGWDVKTLDEKSKGQVAQTVGFLGKASPPYTLEDLNQFGAQVWANDWRWQKNRQRPTLTQLRQEIGKLRAKDFPAGKVYTNGTSPEAGSVNLKQLTSQQPKPY